MFWPSTFYLINYIVIMKIKKKKTFQLNTKSVRIRVYLIHLKIMGTILGKKMMKK